ncbi:MAG: hypothetical protein ABFD82_05355 [Syntrophaceae bacterium]
MKHNFASIKTNLNISHISFGVFSLFVCVLSFFTLMSYPGHAIVYTIFTLALNTLFVCGFTKRKIFFDTFMGVFFWLGFWLKFSVRVAFMGGKFQAAEQIGEFTGSGADYDRALLVSACGVTALLIARFIRSKFLFTYADVNKQVRLEGAFALYRNHRRIVLVSFVTLFVVITVANVAFGIYQRGSVPRAILPFGLSGVCAWLLLFGLASFSAVILDCEFRLKSAPYLVTIISFLESFFSNVSMLSRGMILNGGSLVLGLIENAKRRCFGARLRYKIVIPILFLALFASSVFAVNHLRKNLFYYNFATPTSISKSFIFKSLFASLSIDMDSPAVRFVVEGLTDLEVLLLDRWTGIEGAMAVSSYSGLGWDLWKTAWQERYSHSGTSMYDVKILRSPFADMSEHHFISLPGIVAFFYYPGSYVFLFFSMLLLGLFGAGIEILTFKFSGGNIILCSLIAQVVAYRYASFGYVPYQSYLLFGSIFLNVLIIYCSDRLLLYFNKTKGQIYQSETYTG